MRVALAGLAGAGKTSTGDKLAKVLGVKHIKFSFKDIAKQMGMSLEEFHERIASADDEFDKKIDAEIVKAAEEARDYVCSTWLGAWTTNAEYRVWLHASAETRVNRIMKRDGLTREDATKKVAFRDANNWKRYWEYYGINIMDNSKFDIVINTDNMSVEDACRIIVKMLGVEYDGGC